MVASGILKILESAKLENQTTNYTNHTNAFFKCHPFHSCDSCDSWSVFCFELRARAVGNWNLIFICHLFLKFVISLWVAGTVRVSEVRHSGMTVAPDIKQFV